MARTKNTDLATTQQLGSLIKSARDVMRKDKGLSGDLDRLPMLTWVMFLKFLDDMERLNQEEAIVAAQPYRPLLEAPYRWRDWAANPDGTTGDELIAFINQERAVRPDGEEGPGLFAYLRRLRSEHGEDRRDVIANVFRGVVNRMINGYLLRDVVNKIDGIQFTSSEEINILGHLYESMLREMRDSAGDSGEFYTPRPVVKFMVTVTDPKLGETILDPACGTGGFLTETYEHLARQCHTVGDRSILQERSIYGHEAKPLPYLLAQMNLLLHGVDYPRINYGNSLAQKITEIGDSERVDIILTNPPFGGEEEQGIKNNFPAAMQTSETALLFLQLIMRKLRRRPKPGRAAVVVPDGVLFGEGIATRIKEELLREFNLHTIVRLPNGVFAPYAPIPTNVLFFDRSGPTCSVWYYEHPLPPGRKNYSKTKPLQYSELEPCLAWWSDRKQNDHAWRVPVEELVGDLNLDRKNPRLQLEQPPPPVAVVDRIETTSVGMGSALARLRAALESAKGEVTPTPLRELLTQRTLDVVVEQPLEYEFAGVYSFGRGVFRAPKRLGIEISYQRLTRVRTGDFVYPKLMAWEGAFGLVPGDCDGCVVSPEFPVFEVHGVLPEVLDLHFRSPAVWRTVAGMSRGTNVRRRRLHPEEFLDYLFPLPDKKTQEAIREAYRCIANLRALHDSVGKEIALLNYSVLYHSTSVPH